VGVAVGAGVGVGPAGVGDGRPTGDGTHPRATRLAKAIAAARVGLVVARRRITAIVTPVGPRW
jgi:hypothetical protein